MASKLKRPRKNKAEERVQQADDNSHLQRTHLIKSSSLSSLQFPRPHQLGLSTGLYLSRSSQGYDTTDTGAGGIGEPPPLGGEDQADFAGAPPPIRKAARVVGPPKYHARKAPIVKTYNESALTEVVLYLPPALPSSIVHSKMALSDFVINSAQTYLSLWDLAKKLKVLNLRFPAHYVEKLSDDCQFLNRFLGSVFNQLGKVKSVEELLLPKVILHVQTDLEQIFQPLAILSISISHLFLPMTSNIPSETLEQFDFKAVAAILCKVNVQCLTFISSDETVREFSEKLSSEIKRLKKNAISVNCLTQDLGAPGPNYIVEMGQPTVTGEQIHPLSLVGSLNVTSEECSTSRSSSRSQKPPKKKARSAFSTDCTYSDEAELSCDGPFTSEIWNLERLHGDGIDGSGTTIAVIDSGINYMHPAFKGKILSIKNFVKEEIGNIDCAIDSDGHGTLCAGIAAGISHYCPINRRDPQSRCIHIPPGVAPGAKLVVCKVVKTTNGDVDSDAFYAALEWLKEQHISGRQKIDVVSVSLASTYYSHERSKVISDLTSLGVIIVCCASNVGRLRFQPIAFPARLGHVLCIGAQDQNGKPTSFSPVGRELDFLSPGDDLWGPGPGTMGPFAMDCASGTSCATPGVAGLVCLILHAIARICNSDPDEYQIGGKPLIKHVHNVWVIREILKEMSSSPGHHSEEIGYGTLNPYRVLDRSDEEIMRLINEIIEDE